MIKEISVTDICHQVLDLYSQPQNQLAPDSPPLVRNPPPKKDALSVAPFVIASQHSSPVPLGEHEFFILGYNPFKIIYFLLSFLYTFYN